MRSSPSTSVAGFTSDAFRLLSSPPKKMLAPDAQYRPVQQRPGGSSVPCEILTPLDRYGLSVHGMTSGCSSRSVVVCGTTSRRNRVGHSSGRVLLAWRMRVACWYPGRHLPMRLVFAPPLIRHS
jgi:hypothetical protein